MTIDGIQISDEALRSLCDRYSVKKISLFGSRARGDNRSDSDIDLLVDFLPGSKIDLFDFVGFKLSLQDLLGIKVDLVSMDGLRPRIRETVLREARPVYAVG